MTHSATLAPGSGDATSPAREPVRLAYLVSRFPKITETFVLRELNEIDARGDIDAALFSLFQAPSAPVHSSATPWLDRVSRPTVPQSMLAFLRWLIRRPYTVASTLAIVVGGFWRKPRLLAASLAATVVACAHADEMIKRRVEHVHAHFVGHTATAAWVIRRLTGIEYSVTAHAYDLFEHQDFLARRVRDARFVVTISNYNADFIRRFCRGRVPPISVVRAGLDLTQFLYRDRVIPESGSVSGLCVASLMPHKGHRVLLEALADPSGRMRRINLEIVGDGPERPALEAQIERLGLGERVRLHGSLPEGAITTMFDKADLFVLPSVISPSGRMEGLPVVLMEALACGVPAVATRISGVPELVEDGQTGTLAEQGDVQSLRDAIGRALADPAAALRMSREGRRRVVAEYDVKTSAAALASSFVAVRGETRDATPEKRAAFIAWSRSDRSRELAEAVGGDHHTVFYTSLVRPGLVPLRYLLSALATASFLLRRRPTVVVATNPPIFPAVIAYLYCRAAGAVLVLDSHPRGFGHKGSQLGTIMAPIHRYLVRRARATLVASAELAETVRSWGGQPVLMHEAPPLWHIDALPRVTAEPVIMWVCVYAQDEPLEEVLDAARKLPNFRILITGDVRKCPRPLRDSAPDNVEFTGYWAYHDFEALIERSDVLMVLTTERTSVPRAAFEALEALRPLVLSDWPHLRPMFPHAVFVDNTPTSIAVGLRHAVQRHSELCLVARGERDRQRAHWERQRAVLDELVSSR